MILNFIEKKILDPLSFLFWPFLWIIRFCFVTRVSEVEWQRLKTKKCYHITKGSNVDGIFKNNGIYLQRTVGLYKNSLSPKPGVYFFIEQPNSFQFGTNLALEEYDYKVIVGISDMDRSQIRIRRFDRTLIYFGDYNGPGVVTRLIKSDISYGLLNMIRGVFTKKVWFYWW